MKAAVRQAPPSVGDNPGEEQPGSLQGLVSETLTGFKSNGKKHLWQAIRCGAGCWVHGRGAYVPENFLKPQPVSGGLHGRWLDCRHTQARLGGRQAVSPGGGGHRRHTHTPASREEVMGLLNKRCPLRPPAPGHLERPCTPTTAAKKLLVPWYRCSAHVPLHGHPGREGGLSPGPHHCAAATVVSGGRGPPAAAGPAAPTLPAQAVICKWQGSSPPSSTRSTGTPPPALGWGV